MKRTGIRLCTLLLCCALVCTAAAAEAPFSFTREMVEKTFEGSLPAFIAAFTKHQKISQKEIDEVQHMIDRYRKGE